MNIRIASGHFWLDFENGYILSVFNGYGSHTENNFAVDKWLNIINNKNIFSDWDSKEVEIGIISSQSGNLVTQDLIESNDSVKTVDLKELIEIINLLNNMEEKQ